VPKIVTSDNGQFDSLAGEILREGEHIYIRWASGVVERVEVHLETVVRGVVKDGEVLELKCYRAYMKIPVLGGEAKVFLNGFDGQKS
jgi:hypothetical protein